MKAIIMAGGKGERLRPLTNEIPKPMVPMVTRPVLLYIVELLKKHGITDLALTVGYRPESIMDYFGDGSKFGVSITYFIEKEPLGTAGGVKNCSNFIDGDFFVMSGDAFTEVDLTEMLDFQKYNNGLATICVKAVDNVKGFGVVKTAEDGLIIEFLEKPEFTTEKLVNTGIYLFKKDILELIPSGFYDFGRNLFPSLIGKLYAYETREYWNDIGTLSSYYNTNLYVAEHLFKYGFVTQ